MKYTKEDIIRIVNEEDIEFIRLQFTDIFGQLKNVAVTKSQIEKVVSDQIKYKRSLRAPTKGNALVLIAVNIGDKNTQEQDQIRI